MTITIDLDTSLFLEEHPERFLELLRSRIDTLIYQEFPDDIQGVEITLQDDECAEDHF